jgi:hypothetical protein
MLLLSSNHSWLPDACSTASIVSIGVKVVKPEPPRELVKDARRPSTAKPTVTTSNHRFALGARLRNSRQISHSSLPNFGPDGGRSGSNCPGLTETEPMLRNVDNRGGKPPVLWRAGRCPWDDTECLGSTYSICFILSPFELKSTQSGGDRGRNCGDVAQTGVAPQFSTRTGSIVGLDA